MYQKLLTIFLILNLPSSFFFLNEVNEFKEESLFYDSFSSEKIFNEINYTDFKRGTNFLEWNKIGNWTLSKDGVVSPNVGGWDKPFYWNKKWSLDEDISIGEIILNDINSVFSFARISNEGGGTILEFDGVNNKLKVYAPSNFLKKPSKVVISQKIPFKLIRNRVYRLSLKKVAELYVFEFLDTITLDKVTIDYNSVMNKSIGKMRNGVGFILLSGKITILSSFYGTTTPRNPKVIVFGDSVTDGDTIRNVLGGGYMRRWVEYLKVFLNGDILISSRGGETSNDVQEKIRDIYQYSPKPDYIIYAIGLNDNNLDTYKKNLFKLKDKFKDSEIILVTLYPRKGYEDFNFKLSNWIRSSGFKYVDWRKAMTESESEGKLNLDLFLTDNLHPNIKGHKVLYEQLKLDVPEIFN